MKREYVFGITGFALGLVIAGFSVFNYIGNSSQEKTEVKMSSGASSHLMPDGKQMANMDDEMSMDDMTEVLKGKNGDAFDKEFIDQMIIHHEGAIDMANLALKNGGHQEIKDMAEAIISAQSSEIDQMNQWKDSWGY